MSSTVILAAAAAFALGCVFCLGLWWLSTHRSKRGRTETMKATVWLCLCNGCAWVWCSYLLAYLGREQIAEQLSGKAVTEIIAVILAYAIKSLVENLSKHNNWPDRSGKKEETTLVTNIIVQVLKSLLYDMLPTNLLAFLVAAVVTVGAGFGLWSYYRFAITGWMIVALIALIFLVAFSAMFGYDKLVQLMEQAGWIKAQK